MKTIQQNIINYILYRNPVFNINKIKNLNIFNKPFNNKILFNNNAKYFVIKPKGKKSYIWFTYYKRKIMAILIIINNKNIYDKSNQFYDLEIDFDNTLCYNNVLLYGYYFKNLNNNYFVIDNIYNYNLYNNIIYSNKYNFDYNYKLSLFSNLLPKINNNSIISIKLPIILDNLDNLFKIINNINYNLFCINVYSNSNFIGNYSLNNNNRTTNNKATFKIIPCINQDLYNLFYINDNKEEFYDLALIDSYKTSKFMNKIFRKIKENDNLDLLEESDDEEEFQNINQDKYVNLDKSEIIECEYNFKFKKWIPRNLSNNKIINKNLINSMTKIKSHYIL
tara:strand:+ start:322 stop:1329 length:1008 start_codon:yes stop_codon:yes gene_type:complete